MGRMAEAEAEWISAIAKRTGEQTEDVHKEWRAATSAGITALEFEAIKSRKQTKKRAPACGQAR